MTPTFDFDHFDSLLSTMASAFPIVIVLVLLVGLMATSWFSIRKGPHQT